MEQRDPLNLTLKQLLAELLGGRAPSSTEWIDVRTDDLPWRQLVAAAERGELVVSRVGRKLLMRRAELDRWLEAQRIGRPACPSKPIEQAKPENDVSHLLPKIGVGSERDAS